VPSDAPIRATIVQYSMPALRGVALRITKAEPSRITSGAKATIVPSRVYPASRPSGVTLNSRSRTAGTEDVTQASAPESTRPSATLLKTPSMKARRPASTAISAWLAGMARA
jgi:hypothetical protein